MAEREIRVEARAKINLFLRVLSRRPDGYHDIESLILPISLADEVMVRPASQGLSMQVIGDLAPAVPADDRNLALVAARVLVEACGQSGATIELLKRIPVSAGLGGGSADAAATLLALADLWGCGVGEHELWKLAASVGSDVPAMLHGGPVLVRGRGEVIEPATIAPMWWVVYPLGFPVRAADAYGWWDEDSSTGPDPADLLEAVAAGDLERAAGHLFNDLEAPVSARYPEIAEAKQRLLDAGALAAVMSGSGPTVAGLCRDETHARELEQRVPGSIAVSGPG